MIKFQKNGKNINGDVMNKRKARKIKKVIIVLILVMILTVSVYKIYKIYEAIEISDENYISEKTTSSTSYGETVESVEEESKTVADVIEEVNKSVCGISKLKSTGSSILSTADETELGLGTGIVVSSDGYILSNAHVTGEKYSTCYVTIEDGDTYKGTVVWADTDLDLSITKIKATDLSVATLGTSENIRVGESVYAIGNPIGYEFRKTVTSGIISAINRTIKIEEDDTTTYMSDLIQTDATINPGNSGGPLIYANGEVIGINSVKITSAEGIGFAIPIDVVKPIVEKFIQDGSFDEATLGLYVYDQSVAQYLNLESKFSSGLYVAQVIANGASEKSGLKEGDIITDIDDIQIDTINDLKKYIYTKSPGDIVTLSITRNNKTMDIEVTLEKK